MVETTAGTSSWTLTATAKNLRGAHLLSFFDEQDGDAVSSILESIEITQITVNYEYQAKVASRFDISAALIIGSLVFKLEFKREGQNWSFTASASVDDNHGVETSIGKILDSIVGSDIDLPGFIADIDLQLDGSSKAQLDVYKTASGPGQGMIIIVSFDISGFSFQFIQFRELKGEGNVTPKVKRAFLVSLSKLPSTDIPLLGKLEQPFDEALFMWLTSEDGLTKANIDAINPTLAKSGEKPLPFKIVKKAPADSDILITGGMHFMLVLKDNTGKPDVVLDYAFSTEKSSLAIASLEADQEAPTAVKDNGSSMAAYTKTIGPFSLKNIGFKYSTGTGGKESILTVKLDASVTIGPIAFALLGFGLDLKFDKGANLRHLPTPGPSLEGLAASFDRPPLDIGGILKYLNDTAQKSYAGALTIGYNPWQFQAAGFYGEMLTPTRFDSAFVYCILHGPLITFEFATIEGVCGGFGYNSSLTIPTVKSVMDFPLLQSSQTSQQPPEKALEILLSTSWFRPQNGSFWLAAGLTVKAFEMLDVSAVLIVEWDPDVKIAIAALATASVPGGDADARKLAYVQLGLVAVLDIGAGVLKIDGELTPSSYILDPSCHLTGGFALYSWFNSKDSNLNGDWVFSIGGFHPLYAKPPQYPNPSRLGISWQFSGAISISGQAYFAITPKACMGGGRLDVSLSLPPLYAYLNAYIDFLINYKPFSFLAEAGLTVGVKFTLDLWLVTIHINISIGATLYIKGPPIHGTVHVDFWVFGFNVDFGKQADPPDPLKLAQFIELVCQGKSSGFIDYPKTPVSGIKKEPDRTTHVFAVEDGLVPQNKVDSEVGEMWIVRAATFKFTIKCKFAIESAQIKTLEHNGDIAHTDTVTGTGEKIYAKPMQTVDPVTSSLTVSIKPTEPTLFLEEDAKVPLWVNNSSIEGQVPLGLWGQYDRSDDPSYVSNPSKLLNGQQGKTVNLMTGVRISRPEPLPSDKDTTVPFFVKVLQDLDVKGKYYFPLIPNPNPKFVGTASVGPGQWDLVKNTWEAVGDAGKQVAESWCKLGLKLLGWDEKKVDSEAGKLTGARPGVLVGNLPKYYPWAPLISQK